MAIEYHTPLEKKQSFLRRCHFPLSVSFYCGIAAVVWETWQSARKGLFDQLCLSGQSRKIIDSTEANGGVFHIDGLDNIAKTPGPIVFISNHMSTLETFALPSMIIPAKNMTFIVKDSLLRYPFLGTILQSIESIAISRKNPREDLKTVLEQGTDLLKKGRSLVIFPQSTRSPQFNPANFNTLGIKLAIKAQVPVIPLALKTDFWGTGKFLRDFGPINKSKEIYFSFGEPIAISGNGKEEHEQVISFISSQLKKWS